MKFQKGLSFFLVFLLFFCTACSNSQSDNSSSDYPFSIPSVQNNGMKKIGEVSTYEDYTGSKWEYKVQDVAIYGHYSESDIPEDDFFEGVNDQKLVVVEIKIKKVEGPQRKSDNQYDTLEYLSLSSKSIREAIKTGNISIVFPDLVYFSGHEDGTGAYQYWLDPGEEAVFQLGWCLSDENYTGREKNLIFLTDTDGLALYIGSDLYQGEYIDLTAEE